ncbi:MAG: hypothetical protein JSV99_10390 [Planctomycetota bacterium]|nr:MAG: hypothetical protein JSV99_10390 [Planctomycetota bacterium]
MAKKSGSFFEEHVEKIVLAAVGLVCIWLFVAYVLIGRTYVEFDGKKFSSGGIDNYIVQQTKALESRLNSKPRLKQPYESRVSDFVAVIDSAISNIDVGLCPVQPPVLEDIDINKGKYRLPLIGQVNDIEVEHIRAVAYVPTEEIDEENTYDVVEHEPNDIDFVTVAAKFDVAGLYKRFRECFAGEVLPEEWRDPCLAVPVFAAVQLQRQELLSEGSWSAWEDVPRAQIDHRKRMFEIIEDVEELPAGGIKVRLLQFDDQQIRADLLQPASYQIASAKEEWLPPSLHKEYLEHQREIEAQEKREAKAAEKEDREEGRPDRRSRTPRTRSRQGGMGMSGPFGGGGGGGPPGYGGGGGGPSGGGLSTRRRAPTRRRRVDRDRESDKERRERSKEATKTTTDVYKKFDELLITREKDVAKMDEPLMFWAHDDTVEPEKSYRYRIRLGVYNPIAGTNQFHEQYKSLGNRAILWSEFSDTTEAADIPGRLYFFPREIQEATETVTVQVCRYVLGYWYTKDFTVKQGEMIGNASEYKMTEEEEKEKVTVPEIVEYATGAVLVDVMPVNDWSGGKNLRARHYFDMLYSFDGANIERVPIKSRYWSEELLSKFNEIKRSEKEPKEPLREWGTRAGLDRRVTRPGEVGPPGYGPPGYGPPGYGPPGFGPPGYGPPRR